MPDDFDADVVSVAALAEPIRRALYLYVAAQDGSVGREQAATGVGVALHAAKFHLDKLVEDGLLDIEYSRPPGRGGPGAGRPAKRYRRAHRDISVSLPERRYDLAAHVMAEAIETARAGGVPMADALRDAATGAGRALAEQARGRHEAGPALVGAVGEVLLDNGYEPRITTERVTLANCPFHSLAATYPTLTCGMNLDLINGLLGGLDATHLQAALDPAPGRCCVIVSNTSP